MRHECRTHEQHSMWLNGESVCCALRRRRTLARTQRLNGAFQSVTMRARHVYTHSGVAYFYEYLTSGRNGDIKNPG